MCGDRVKWNENTTNLQYATNANAEKTKQWKSIQSKKNESEIT